MRLVLDENLSPLHASELRSLGHDVWSVVEVGFSGATDDQVRSYAVDDDRILVTLDAEFANVISFPPANTPGVVRLKVRPPTEERIRQAIQRALLLMQDVDLTDCLAVVDEHKIRIRK